MDKLFKDNSHEEFSTICNEILNHLFEGEKMDIENIIYFNSARKQIRDIIINTCCSINEISNILIQNEYEEEKVKYFISELEKRRNELLYLILLYHNSKQGEALATFDWTMKLVCGTSELQTFKYPIVQLGLTTVTNSEQKQRMYDLDKSMLAKLIDVLESCEVN